jgi:hypothetical protein
MIRETRERERERERERQGIKQGAAAGGLYRVIGLIQEMREEGRKGQRKESAY